MRWRALAWTTTPALIVGGLVIAMVGPHLRGGCASHVFAQVPSPNGQLQAVVYEVDCGATTGFSRQVTILPVAGQALEANFSPQGFFAVSLRAANVDSAAMQDALIAIDWLSEKHLVITYPAGAELIRSAESGHGVQVSYRTSLVGEASATTAP